MENFDKSVYKNKQCCFVTERPLFWAEAIEKYILTGNGVHGKTQYKLMKDSEKHFMIKFKLFYRATKQITIFINLLTGTLLVKGASFETWIDEEFDKVIDLNKQDDDVQEDSNIEKSEMEKQIEASNFYSKKRFKDTGISVTESLSVERLALLNKCKLHYGKFNCWTKDSRIYVIDDNYMDSGGVLNITCEEDIR